MRMARHLHLRPSHWAGVEPLGSGVRTPVSPQAFPRTPGPSQLSPGPMAKEVLEYRALFFFSKRDRAAPTSSTGERAKEAHAGR